MSPYALDKTGTRHTDTQWKAKAPHIQLLLPAPLINKPYGPEHEEFHACASILIQLTADAPSCLPGQTSFKPIIRQKTVHVQPKGWRGAKEHSSCVNLSRKLAFFAHFTRASLIIEYVPPLSLLDRRTPLNFRTSFLCSLRFCSRFSLYRRFDYDKIG